MRPKPILVPPQTTSCAAAYGPPFQSVGALERRLCYLQFFIVPTMRACAVVKLKYGWLLARQSDGQLTVYMCWQPVPADLEHSISVR